MALTLVQRADIHGERIAIVDRGGEQSYARLLEASARVASALLGGRSDLEEERVAFLLTPGFDWVAAQWGIWRAGGIAVPLPLNCPAPELEYALDDSRPATVLFDLPGEPSLAPLAASRGLRSIPIATAATARPSELPLIAPARRAMIVYTSGTTSRPKGVVTTHANIEAQITALIEAWQWSAADRTALCLPLHHVHGIVNVVTCTLWAGATCEMLPRFDAGTVWQRLESGELTLFMAVPTVYVRLIAAWEASSPERRARLSQAGARLRLMVSGSAALPVSLLERWRQISGHTLLERYGMTEIGMALSNPLHGERVPGAVGTPLPRVEVRLVDDNGLAVPLGTPGEIEVRGPAVFREYWARPEATRAAFREGWFRTGDVALVEKRPSGNVYRILGRNSTDIIKTGGHKVSALEIEEVLLAHPSIAECAVVGLPDAEWGERVGAAVVLHDGTALHLDEVRRHAGERLAAWKLPSKLLILRALPRNAMGKVTKPAVKAMFDQQDDTGASP